MVVGQPGKLVPVLRVVGSSPILVAKKKGAVKIRKFILIFTAPFNQTFRNTCQSFLLQHP